MVLTFDKHCVTITSQTKKETFQMTENIKTKPQNDEIPVEDFKKSDDSLDECEKDTSTWD